MGASRRILGSVLCLQAMLLTAEPAQEMRLGEPAPDFSLRGLDEKEISLKALHGRVVVLHFWASYWPLCEADMADLDKLYRDYKGQAVSIFGVNVGQLPRVVRDFVRKKGYLYPQLLNARGELILAYQATDAPTFVVIDKEGRIVYYLHDERGGEGVRSAIRKALE